MESTGLGKEEGKKTTSTCGSHGNEGLTYVISFNTHDKLYEVDGAICVYPL